MCSVTNILISRQDNNLSAGVLGGREKRDNAKRHHAWHELNLREMSICTMTPPSAYTKPCGICIKCIQCSLIASTYEGRPFSNWQGIITMVICLLLIPKCLTSRLGCLEWM